MTELLSIREAQSKILAGIKPTGTELRVVEEAYGRILAEEIVSPVDLPPYANSSMDGFAVNSHDLTGASPTSPVSLPVRMDIPAGFTEKAVLTTGTTARILTGAPLPQGADAVIPIESTDQAGFPQNTPLPGTVGFFSSVKPGDYTRPVGQDIQIGQLILQKNRSLHPQDIGLLVAMGIRQVRVMKKPRIALFSSGNELLTPDEPPAFGKIYDSNRFVLTGILNSAGADVIQLGIAQDDPQSVMDILDKARQSQPDLIISSAGVSVGAFDFVHQVVKEHGSLAFWKVNMRPGKPIAFGRYNDIPFLGLPGNPVSAYVGCIVFALPFIRQLQGQPPFIDNTIRAVLTEPIESDGRESYLRGIVHLENGIQKASLTGHQGSGNLFSLVQANALLIVPAGVTFLPAGAEVSAWMLE